MTQPIEHETYPREADSGERISVAGPRDVDSASRLRRDDGVLASLRRNVTVTEGVIAIYFTLMLGAVAMGKGPGHDDCVRTVLVDIALFATCVVVTRGGILRPGSFAQQIGARVAVFCSVFLSYFQLRHILPAVRTDALDANIFAFDMRVFGVEPSLFFDRYVTPQTVEWFAFFYFGYFFILSFHVLPMMFNGQSRFRIAHFALGMTLVYCTGQLVYMIVPGWGPYRFLADRFEHPLSGGLFWPLVKATVDGAGAQKDIFPSLHTAGPTFFAVYSFLHRLSLPYRYTWPLVAFAALQIIIATMFLRWHYVIDIFAGLTVAFASALVSYKIIQWETRRRREAGATPIFEVLEWPWSSRDASRGETRDETEQKA